MKSTPSSIMITFHIHSGLPHYLETLKDYNKYGDYDDPELVICVARSLVNISCSDESHLYFVHQVFVRFMSVRLTAHKFETVHAPSNDRLAIQANHELHLRLFREPWLGLNKGEVAFRSF